MAFVVASVAEAAKATFALGALGALSALGEGDISCGRSEDGISSSISCSGGQHFSCSGCLIDLAKAVNVAHRLVVEAAQDETVAKIYTDGCNDSSDRGGDRGRCGNSKEDLQSWRQRQR